MKCIWARSKDSVNLGLSGLVPLEVAHAVLQNAFPGNLVGGPFLRHRRKDRSPLSEGHRRAREAGPGEHPEEVAWAEGSLPPRSGPPTQSPIEELSRLLVVSGAKKGFLAALSSPRVRLAVFKGRLVQVLEREYEEL